MTQQPTEAEDNELRTLFANGALWDTGADESLLPTIRPQLRRRRRRRQASIGAAAAAGLAALAVLGVTVLDRPHPGPASISVSSGGGHALPACTLTLKPGTHVNQTLNADGGLVLPLVDRDGVDCTVPDQIGAVVTFGTAAPGPAVHHPVLGPAGPTADTRTLRHGHVAVVSIVYPYCLGSCDGQHGVVALIGADGAEFVSIPTYSSKAPVFTGLRVE